MSKAHPETAGDPGLDARRKELFERIRKLIASERVGILQPQLLTKPRCYYLGLDKEVR